MNRKVKHLMWELVTLLKTHIFSTYESFKENSTLVFIDFFYPADNVLLCKSMPVHCQLFVTYMFCYCL